LDILGENKALMVHMLQHWLSPMYLRQIGAASNRRKRWHRKTLKKHESMLEEWTTKRNARTIWEETLWLVECCCACCYFWSNIFTPLILTMPFALQAFVCWYTEAGVFRVSGFSLARRNVDRRSCGHCCNCSNKECSRQNEQRVPRWLPFSVLRWERHLTVFQDAKNSLPYPANTTNPNY